jgi:hypothetical protein
MVKHVQTDTLAGKLAWREFKELTLAAHADKWPGVYYGIISAPDYWDPDKGTVGNWAKPWPQLLMHLPSQQLLSFIRFAGVWPGKDGILINPGFPFHDFSWQSERMKVCYTRDSANGYFKAIGKDRIKMQVRIPGNGRKCSVKVNGKRVKSKAESGFAVFYVDVMPDIPLNWEVLGK